MVQELTRPPAEPNTPGTADIFPATAPAANPVFYRTYSRKTDGVRESWPEVIDRTLQGLIKLGQLSPDEADLIRRNQLQLRALTSGRWLWIGGTAWAENPQNFSGAYNCTSTNAEDWRAFGLMMDLAMMGCGTGAVLEPRYIQQLPPIRNSLSLTVEAELGVTPADQRREQTTVAVNGQQVTITVGDSRQGWVSSYQTLLELSTDDRFNGDIDVTVNLHDVRPAGEALKGFGGVANPVKLPEMYQKCVAILNKAVGRQLNSVECCLLIDQAAVTIVAGNIRRCLPEDALVHTDHGLVPIKEVQVGDRVQTPIGFRRVVNKFDQGIQDVYELETNATVPRATLQHRMAVLTNATGSMTWKRLEDLAAGDRLLHSTQLLPGTVTTLPQDTTAQRPNHSRTAKPLTIPALTPEIAWLMGFTHGDGYVALGRNKHNKPYGRVEWAMNAHQPELSQRLQDKIDQALGLFGLTASHGQTQGENTAKSICSSIRLAEYFHQHIKQPHQPLVVPPFILQGSVEVRSAYLAGLMDSDGMDRDGAVNNRPPHLVTTVYPKFARQVAAVLSSLGFTGRMTVVRPHVSHWQVKYNVTIPAFKSQYNAIIAPHSLKGKLREGLKMHGFTVPGEMMRETYTYSEMQAMGFQGSRKVASNYERYQAESEIDLDIPVTVKGLGSYDSVQTYDIEVEEAHCFYCDGYLTHNSAGIRQFAHDDTLGSTAKDNLWQQDENGNWRIDPERDALRMANHTRVYHHKPTLAEMTAAVQKQLYSGEGAIQYAPEAIARSNADLLGEPLLKQEFLEIYTSLGPAEAKGWVRQRCPDMPEDELEHRFQRYGLNPCGEIIGSQFHCVAGDTFLITRSGMAPIQSLVGEWVEVWNGQRWSRVVPIQTGTNRQLYRVQFNDGSYLDVTEGHRFFVKDRFQKNYQERTTAQLMAEWDSRKYAIHTEPFQIDYQDGKFIDPIWAYTLGQLVGDGSVCGSQEKPQLQLRLYGAKSYRSLAIAGRTSGKTAYYAENPATPCLLYTGFERDQFDGHRVRDLKANAQALDELATWDREAILHFIAGLADADGSLVPSGGIRIYLSGYDRAYRCYLLLLKCGIRSSVNLVQRAGSKTNLGTRNKDLWYLQITDCAALPCQRLEVSGGHTPASKGKWQVIRSIEPLPGLHNTFCFEEKEFHKGVFGGTLTGQCNLAEVHLNQIDPHDRVAQDDAFKAAALSVAVLLNHQFTEERYRKSREWDPIVGVSFTGLFDFFVHAFGMEWLQWWTAGRPDTAQGQHFKAEEAAYLNHWREVVHQQVWDYCDRHGLRRPNRCTTVQPSGTKALLTGASSGWHPPKAARFLRRITFRRDDPVALACLDYGYNIVPSQADKDDQGNLLQDPFDPRCTEWLVEIPTAVSWADLPGADGVDISQFSALAQFDFYMQVQRHYTRHNTSATIELRESEVDALAQAMHQVVDSDGGYISAALLARFDDHQTFPRLPFEPVDQATYDRLLAEVTQRRKTDNFQAALQRYDQGLLQEAGPAGCDSDKCLMPEVKPT